MKKNRKEKSFSWVGLLLVFFALGVLGLGVWWLYLSSDLDRSGAGSVDSASEGREVRGLGESDANIDSESGEDVISDNARSDKDGNGREGVSGEVGESSKTVEDGDCYNVQVAYALKNFQTNEICDLENGGVCEKKSVNCSVEGHNLDYEGGGAFEIKSVIYEEGGDSEESIDSFLEEKSIEPRGFEVFESSFVVESVGAEGDANKDLICGFNTVGVPQKVTCS